MNKFSFILLCAMLPGPAAHALPKTRVVLSGRQTSCVRAFLPAALVNGEAVTSLAAQNMTIEASISAFEIRGVPKLVASGIRKLVESRIRSQFGSKTAVSSITHAPGVHDDDGEVTLSLGQGADASTATITATLRYNPVLLAQNALGDKSQSLINVSFDDDGSLVETQAVTTARYLRGDWDALLGGSEVTLTVLDPQGTFAAAMNTALSEHVLHALMVGALQGAGEDASAGHITYEWLPQGTPWGSAILTGSLSRGFQLTGPLHDVTIEVNL